MFFIYCDANPPPHLYCIQSNQTCSKSPSATSTRCQNYYWKVPFNQYPLKPNRLSTRRLLAHWDPSKPQDRCLQKQCSNITVTRQTSGSLDELKSIAQTSISTTVNRLKQHHRRDPIDRIDLWFWMFLTIGTGTRRMHNYVIYMHIQWIHIKTGLFMAYIIILIVRKLFVEH